MERSFLPSFLFYFPPPLRESVRSLERISRRIFYERIRELCPHWQRTNCRAENRILFRAGKHGEVSLRPTEQTAACNNINPNERLLVGIFLFLSSSSSCQEDYIQRGDKFSSPPREGMKRFFPPSISIVDDLPFFLSSFEEWNYWKSILVFFQFIFTFMNEIQLWILGLEIVDKNILLSSFSKGVIFTSMKIAIATTDWKKERKKSIIGRTIFEVSFARYENGISVELNSIPMYNEKLSSFESLWSILHEILNRWKKKRN